MKKYILLSAVTIQLWIGFCYGQQTPFKDGDRVCYIGSSIAMNGECFHFTNLFYATRYPGKKLHFLNSGISGDVTDRILSRLESDILAYNPTWCAMMIEENDLNPSLYRAERSSEPNIKDLQEEAVQHWMKNVDLILEKLMASGVKVALQTPTVYDDIVKSPTPNSYGINNNLKRCAEHLKALASKHSLLLVDCWTALSKVNNKIQEKDSTKTIIGYDRMHVGGLGHFIMSNEFLSAQNVNKNVSHIIVEATKNKIALSGNCIVSGLNANTSSVSFSAKADALPFPAPSEINPDSFFCFTDDMNADIIQVKGLKKGNYTIDIDGTIIAKFSAEELNKGINLSKYHNTPQYQQAEKVLEKFREYWKNERLLRALKYVEYQHHNDLKDIKSVEELKTNMLSILEKYKSGSNYGFFTKMFESYIANKPMEPELIAKAENILQDIYAVNKPVAHSYKISKAGN